MKDLRTYGYTLPLGLRNNNPGNLRDAGIKWIGRVGSNNGFTVFDTLDNGIRAYGLDIKNKIIRGLNTINKLIPVYAPPNENDTNRYIKDMVVKTGFSADKVLIPDLATLSKLARAQFFIENGSTANSFISDEDIESGLSEVPGLNVKKATISFLVFVIFVIIAYLLLK